MRRACKSLKYWGATWHDAVSIRYAQTSTEVGKVAPFWSQHPVKDLEDSSVELELARRHNSSFPYYKNQVIVGEIVRVDRDHVSVYTGNSPRPSFDDSHIDWSAAIHE